MRQEFLRESQAPAVLDMGPGTEVLLPSEDVPTSDNWFAQGDPGDRAFSRFPDRLPAGQEHAQTARTKRPSGRPGVLVVDENEAIRSMLDWGLERHGFTVWSADTSRHACRLYRDYGADIHVVLLDVSRASWNGPSTLFALREFNPEVRICLMSSDLGPYTRADLLQLGAVAFIQKPFRLDEVVHLLRALVDCSTNVPT